MSGNNNISGELDQRFYTSQFGRFMSADRFKRAAKLNDSGSWNKYSYTRGDPVNRVDRHGTCDTDITLFDASSGSGDDTGCDDDSGGGDNGVAATCAVNNLVYDPNTNECEGPQITYNVNPIPAIPIYCEPDVIAALKVAWGQSSNGTNGTEAGFRVDGIPLPNLYTIVPTPFTNQQMVPGTTVNIFHVNPNKGDPKPSRECPVDRRK
jgi:RHS repeat-associated protein